VINNFSQLNQSNMKSIKSMVGVLLGGAVAGALMCQSAYGVPLDTPGTSVLPSVFGGGKAVTINWEVSTTLHSGLYTYEYQVVNGSAPGFANGSANLDFFSVSFNTGNASVGGANPNNATHIVPTDVDWTYGPLAIGGSTPALNTAGVLYFTSPIPPTLGPADASDEIPPSPFVSGPYVPVPATPDGGMTLALLGFGLMGIETLRRRLMA
jgi:hypothetical protein